MMSLVNKSADWTPNYHKILIFSPPKSLKRLRAARIDQLADSNEPAITNNTMINLTPPIALKNPQMSSDTTQRRTLPKRHY